jgi:hypothetical protein
VERQMAVSEIEGDEERLKNSFRSVLSAHTGEVTVLCVASIAGGKQALLSGSKGLNRLFFCCFVVLSFCCFVVCYVVYCYVVLLLL